MIPYCPLDESPVKAINGEWYAWQSGGQEAPGSYELRSMTTHYATAFVLPTPAGWRVLALRHGHPGQLTDWETTGLWTAIEVAYSSVLRGTDAFNTELELAREENATK